MASKRGRASSSRKKGGESFSEKLARLAAEILLAALEEGDRKAAFWVLEHHPKSPFRRGFTPEPEGRIEVTFGRGSAEGDADG